MGVAQIWTRTYDCGSLPNPSWCWQGWTWQTWMISGFDVLFFFEGEELAPVQTWFDQAGVASGWTSRFPFYFQHFCSTLAETALGPTGWVLAEGDTSWCIYIYTRISDICKSQSAIFFVHFLRDYNPRLAMWTVNQPWLMHIFDCPKWHLRSFIDPSDMCVNGWITIT